MGDLDGSEAVQRAGAAAQGGEHPALAAHLERTVQTGTYCAYLPDPRVPTRWET